MGPEEQVSQGQEQEVVDNSQGQQQDTGTGINPAWNELLSELPSSLHSVAIPHLQKWDKNYQEGIGKVHSQYESYKPFVEQGIDPAQLQYGLQVLDAIQNRPQEVYAAMQQYFGEQQGEEEEESFEEQGQQSEPVDITQHPQFQQLAEMVQVMAQSMVQQQSLSQEQQEDEELEQEFAQAREQFGDYDEEYVMAKILAAAERGQDLSVADAVQMYKQLEQGILTNANRPGPPKLLSGGGASANSAPSPANLGDKDRKALVASMLAANKQD